MFRRLFPNLARLPADKLMMWAALGIVAWIALIANVQELMRG